MRGREHTRRCFSPDRARKGDAPVYLVLVVAMYERKGFHCLNKAFAVRDPSRPVRMLRTEKDGKPELRNQFIIRNARRARRKKRDRASLRCFLSGLI